MHGRALSTYGLAMSDRAIRLTALGGILVTGILLYLEVAYLDDKGKVHPNSTMIALFLWGGVLIAILATPEATRRLLRRLESVEAFGVKVAISVARATRASRHLVEERDGVRTSERPKTGDPASDLDEIAKTIRARLRFVRDAVLDDPDNISEAVMVPRLAGLGLLQHDEVGLINDVLGGVRDDISHWIRNDRERFLDAAWRFGTRLATMVFDRHVRLSLRAHGCFIADFDQPRGHRPDFLVGRDGAWALIAARVSADTVPTTRARLAAVQVPPQASRRAVVVPEYAEDLEDDLTPPVLTLRLGSLLRDPTLQHGDKVLRDAATT